MRPALELLSALSLVCVLLCTHSIAFASQRLIVRFVKTNNVNNHTPTEQQLKAISAASQSSIKFVRSGSGGNQIIELDNDLSPAQLEQISAKIAQLEMVSSVALDRRYRAQFAPSDPEFSRQWYLSNEQGGINAVDAWDYTTGNSNTVIAVLDTGILPHSDFVGRYLQGYDFISDLFTANDGDGRDANPADPGDALAANDCEIGDPLLDEPSSWHGTAITGLIAANTDNDIGIAGIDHRVEILPVRVLGKCGGYSSDIVDAIRWAAGMFDPALPSVNPNPANIINLSFGGIGDCTAAEQAAIDEVTAAGVLVVAGAGNSEIDVTGFAPANCDNVLTVAASTRQGGETCYTNFGAGIDISAPGGNSDGINNCSGGAADSIYTTSNSGVLGPGSESYASYAGTSFAAPMVSATAALMRSVNPALTPAEIQAILETSAREFPTGTSDSYGDCDTSRCGHGVLDAYAAVSATRADALNMQGTGTIQMSLVEDCVLEDAPSIDVAIDRVSGNGSVAANVVTKRISATAGDDFGAIDQLVVWPGDDMETKYLSIPIYGDNSIEGAEYFSVEIVAISPNANIGYPASTRITIVSTDGNTIKTCAQPTVPAPGPPPSSGGGSVSLFFLCIQILLFFLNNNCVLGKYR
ncbi:MAG: S8 family serine peptidase [Gammaproteobacteria bacterium]|nr:S8 family serine peptidase [Gammaproteobacteria bacterium]